MINMSSSTSTIGLDKEPKGFLMVTVYKKGGVPEYHENSIYFPLNLNWAMLFCARTEVYFINMNEITPPIIKTDRDLIFERDDLVLMFRFVRERTYVFAVHPSQRPILTVLVEDFIQEFEERSPQNL